MKLDKERFNAWLNDDPDRLNGMEEMAEIPYPPRERIKEKRQELQERIDAQPVGQISFLSRKFWQRVYSVFAVICCAVMTVVLLSTVAAAPRHHKRAHRTVYCLGPQGDRRSQYSRRHNP